jgi:signal transduction histidine kinase
VADKTSANIPFKHYVREIGEVLENIVATPNIVVAHLDESGEAFVYDFIKDKYLEDEHMAWQDYSWLKFVRERSDVLLLQRAHIERLQRDGKLLPTFNPIFSWLAAPLKTGTQTIGVIALASYDPAFTFGQREKEILAFVAHHVGTAMERRRNEEKMIQALELAQQASKTKSQFLANMSHELRTPLNSIIGYSRRLLKQRDTLTEAQAQAMEVISRNAGNLLTMINDVLDLSRVEAGKMSYSIQKIDLTELVCQVADELEPLASQKGILLQKPGEKHRNAMADPARMRQVLVNIIGNAIKFTDSGSVSIAITPRERDGHSYVTVAVHDTGFGIPEEKIRSIFNVFEQANPDRDAARGGSGLGLAIAARLMDDMKGTITVSSKANEGSTFYIDVPSVRREEQEFASA